MAQENETMPPQEAGAASAPPESEDFDAALDALNGVNSDPKGAEPAPQASPSPAPDDPAPSLEDAASRPAGDTPPASTTPNDEIWSKVDPEVRAAHEQALRDANLRYEGLRGRNTGTENALRQLRERYAELEARVGKQPQADQESQGEGAQPEAEREQALKDLREEYPEVAAPILDLIAEQQAKLDKIEEPIRTLQQREQLNEQAQQAAILIERHPDWDAIRSDPRLKDWMQTQPRAILEAIARNSDRVDDQGNIHSGLVDGAEVAWVVDQWKKDMGIGTSSIPNTQAPDPEAERRERQKANGRDIAGSGPPATSRIPTDFDAGIDYLNARDAARA